jgi:hypothetical protein
MQKKQIRLDQAIDISVKDCINIADFKVGSVVLDQAIGVQCVGSYLTSPGNGRLGIIFRLFGTFQFFKFLFVESRAQDLHAGFPVFELGAFALALDHDIGRQVGDPDSGTCFVHMLSSGAA